MIVLMLLLPMKARKFTFIGRMIGYTRIGRVVLPTKVCTYQQ